VAPMSKQVQDAKKSQTFSPAQPWRAETRLVPSKAAVNEEARRTLRYVEPLSDTRTPLADFFSILLAGYGRLALAKNSLIGSWSIARKLNP
jgi:hypothetical protein